MSRIDLHADELFDRARRGSLSTSDAARLQSHCQACIACRLELDWIGDGLHDAAPSGDDRRLAASAVEAVLGGAMDSASAPVPARKRTTRWQALALLCGGLLMASASAALYQQVQEWRTPQPQATPTRASSTPAAPTTPQRPQPRPAPATLAPTPTPPPTLAPTPTPTPAPVPTRPPAPAPGPEARAEALFARANAQRAAGDFAAAHASYTALARRFPGTRSELQARISHAQLLLRHLQQPAQARLSFESYLTAQPRGTLAEEARIGVAISAARLGDVNAERNAWQELLDQHPGSLHAVRARARLRGLLP